MKSSAKIQSLINPRGDNRGIAMVGALAFLVVLMGLSQVFVVRAVHEVREARKERETSAAFYEASGGAQAALRQLDILINNYLQNTIAGANPSGVINFATQKVVSGDGIGWLVYAVRDNNVPVLIQNEDQAEYAQAAVVGSQTYAYVIIMTEKKDPSVAGPDAWDFPFSYRIESTGTEGAVQSRVVVLGDFTVRVQRDNFAKFALFTNSQTTSGGTQVWFTDKTNFAGPVHTNGRFNFALNPSGTFEAAIVQHEQTARFYNNGSSILLDADANGTKDVPVFNNTFTRGAETVSFTSSTDEADMAEQAAGGNPSFGSNGIYVPTQGATTALKGGIYVKGDGAINLSVDGSSNAVYTITQGSTTKKITVNRVAFTTTVETVGSGSPVTYQGLPDGQDDVGTLIYVEGNVNGLGGTVQEDTQVTIASRNDMVITNNLVYSDFAAGSGNPGEAGYVPPSAQGADNLVGLVSWQGDVRVGTAAPDDVQVHGTIFASQGVFAVDNYTDISVGHRGTATLLGGVISDNYGAFGQFSGATGQHISGYGRNFVYDERMQAGQAPPYFPSLQTFIAFTNDIADKMVWQEGE